MGSLEKITNKLYLFSPRNVLLTLSALFLMYNISQSQATETKKAKTEYVNEVDKGRNSAASSNMDVNYEFLPDSTKNKLEKTNGWVTYTIKVYDSGNPVYLALTKMLQDSNVLDSAYTNQQGIAELVFNIVGVEKEKDILPRDYYVDIPYPQPANDKSNVDFGIAKRQSITYVLYTLPLIEEVAKGTKELSAGHYTLTMDGLENLANATYLLMIKGEGFDEMIKIMKLGDNKFGYSKIPINFSVVNGQGPTNVKDFSGNKELKEQETELELKVDKEYYEPYSLIFNAASGDTTMIVNLNREMATLEGKIYDNVSITPLDGKVEVYDEGNVNVFSTQNKEFNFEVFSGILDSIKVYSVDASTDSISSFVVTYHDFPVENDLDSLGFMVTTFNRLIYGYNIDPDSAVTKDEFKEFNYWGIFKESPACPGCYGLKALNYENMQNPIYPTPDPETDHGYMYWIPRDQMVAILPGEAGDWTEEQQIRLDSLIRYDINTKIRDVDKRPQVHIASAEEEAPGFIDSTGHWKPYPGIFVPFRSLIGFWFAAQDYNDDGIYDAAFILLGPNFTSGSGLYAARQELHSVHVTQPIDPDNIPGIVYRSVFVEGGQSLDFSHTVDEKAVNGILLNFSENLTTTYNNFIKVNYQPGAKLNDIVGIR